MTRPGYAGKTKGRSMVALVESTAREEAARDALAERLFQATLATWDIATAFLGHRLGLYQALSEVEPATSAEVAAAAGLDERYTREWLEQQVVTGILTCENRGAVAADRRYVIPAGHEAVLIHV